MWAEIDSFSRQFYDEGPKVTNTRPIAIKLKHGVAKILYFTFLSLDLLCGLRKVSNGEVKVIGPRSSPVFS